MPSLLFIRPWLCTQNNVHYYTCICSTADDDFSFDSVMNGTENSPVIFTFTEAGKQCVNITIAMDNLLESSEHFSVVMGSQDDRVKSNNTISRIYIIDSGSEFMQRTHSYVL